MKTRQEIWPYCVPQPTNRRILDNFGLTINLKMLEAWPEFKAAKDMLFGTNWASKLWMRYVSPLLTPKRYEELKSKFEEERQAMQTRYLNAVMEAASKKIEPCAPSSSDSATSSPRS